MTDLDSNIVLLDSFGTLNRNLVVRPVPLFHAEVVVLDVEFKVGQDELINRFPGPRENKQGMTKERSVLLAGQISRESNPREEGSSSSKGGGGRERERRKTYLLPNLLPNDPSHLVPVELNDGVGDFDLGQGLLVRERGGELCFGRFLRRVGWLTGGSEEKGRER